ncbi:MAG: aminotransferase class III-fold pyridoxal phosphate-dependent enzyme [Halobellus sp.]
MDRAVAEPDVDGNGFLDFTSHVASSPLGYNNPTVREKLAELDLPSPIEIAGQSFYASAGGSPEEAVHRRNFPEEKSRLSSTWGAGDVLAALQGAVTIDVIDSEGLLENAREKAEQPRARFREADLADVSNARGKGVLIAFDLPTKERRDAVIRAALERGLLTLGCGYRSIRLLPPLDVTEREIDMGADLLVDAVQAVEASA